MPSKSIDDPELGRIERIRYSQGWTFRIDVGNAKAIECTVGDEATFPPAPEVLETVRRTMRWLSANEASVRHFIVSEMLETAHDWINFAGEPPLTRESFESRLRIDGVNFSEDLTADVYYGDDGIFLGHSVVVSITPRLEFKGKPFLVG
jgi:hypothetical protein